MPGNVEFEVESATVVEFEVESATVVEFEVESATAVDVDAFRAAALAVRAIATIHTRGRRQPHDGRDDLAARQESGSFRGVWPRSGRRSSW